MKKLVIPFVIFSAILLNGCNEDGEKIKNSLSGKWKARWELNNPELNEVFSPEQMVMDGEVIFEQDRVRIRAFGFEGCVFTSDTSENILSFEKNDSILNLMISNRQVIFSYMIKEEKNNYLRLLLMDDISLTLTK
jgi:hypothetical protein